MRIATQTLLSNYLRGKASLEQVRLYVEDVDWDDTSLPQKERVLLLQVEAYLAGLDEGFNEEADLKAHIAQSLPIAV